MELPNSEVPLILIKVWGRKKEIRFNELLAYGLNFQFR